MVIPPQLQMACDCLKCQTEYVSREASEWQLGQSVGKHKVTWPAGLYLQSREWVLGSERQLRVRIWSHPRWSLKTWPEGLLGPKVCLEKQTNQPSLNQKEEWSNKSKLCLCT